MSGGTPANLHTLLSAIRAAPSIGALREATRETFRALGFSQLFYMAPVIRNRAEGRLFYNQGFPEPYEQAYKSELQAIDPYPDYACMSGLPVRWRDPELRAISQADRDAFLSAAERLGLKDGLGIPIYGTAARVGYLALGGPIAPMRFETAELPLLQAAASVSYLKYCQTLAAEAGQEPALSRQEIAVLVLMAQGKSNADVGAGLGLAPHTINTYVRRIFSKLSVTDRTSAVLRGIARGYILASDIVIDSAVLRRTQKDESGDPS
jgi:DNA-binding CsgD family transcriptional regulator